MEKNTVFVQESAVSRQISAFGVEGILPEVTSIMPMPDFETMEIIINHLQ